MSPYLKFDAERAARLLRQGETPALPALQEEQSSRNSKNSKGITALAQCLVSEGEEQSGTAPEKSHTQPRAVGAAIFAIPAIPEEHSSKNSKNSNPEPLTQHYPCVVCGKTERWNDGGIWRCVACWPSGSLA